MLNAPALHAQSFLVLACNLVLPFYVTIFAIFTCHSLLYYHFFFFFTFTILAASNTHSILCILSQQHMQIAPLIFIYTSFFVQLRYSSDITRFFFFSTFSLFFVFGNFPN
ncbi:hypothetical protein VCUG_00718 [Vavraia culicis subsp. floridensis]|uniref:Uncharacterized protein n=1 Tax=Vavraia culicis (isolate floridensis) TaxID=948595 RepID=L2GWM2_VAVCU|nr:uncharacterized protein VCUG_00718 [Vavraia culicis subsp. floridensis]ELA47757.1 hypothetical protein VCUG_00718 [Vavraia culicis subsp. floridensis]